MAAIRVLVDIDVLIDYFNAGDHSALLENPRNRIYYSIVKRNDQLLAKRKLALPSAKPSRARCGVSGSSRSPGRSPAATRFCAENAADDQPENKMKLSPGSLGGREALGR